MILINSANIYSFNTQSRKVFESVGFRRIAEEWYRYDAEWEQNDDDCGTTVPYWYAVLEPVHGRRNKPEDFKKVNEVLFPKGTDALDIYEWTTDWSDYFDAGHEWYGACCWSVYDKAMKRYVVMLVSATD